MYNPDGTKNGDLFQINSDAPINSDPAINDQITINYLKNPSIARSGNNLLVAWERKWTYAGQFGISKTEEIRGQNCIIEPVTSAANKEFNYFLAE
jgi:hypothetical protein